MKFDTNDSRCGKTEELADVALQLFQMIPEGDRQEIENVCDSVVFCDGGAHVAVFSAKDKDIRVSVYDLIRFREPGRRGVLAHEFGHAFDYAKSGELIGSTNRSKLEKRADNHAKRWGFEKELRTRDRDRQALWPSAPES